MAAVPILTDRHELELPVDAETAMTFSPAQSQSRTPSESLGHGQGVPDERAPLLGGAKKERKPFFRPRPLWIVPFALLSSLSRGMTLAPRVQVYTQLSCNAIHQNYNHTNSHPSSFVHSLIFFPSNSSVRPHTPVYYDFDYNMPLPILFPEVPTAPPTLASPIYDPTKICLSDPAVQSGAARLQTTVMVTMGVLSALTTSFWGHFSERYGRTKVLAASSFGLFVTDLAFLLAVQPSTSSLNISNYISPHLLLLLAPFTEGLFGGFTTLTATTSAYISDCTSDGSRASIFSRFMGVAYTGIALGPMIGAALLRHASQSAPSVVRALAKGVEGPADGVPGVAPIFAVALACTTFNLFLGLFVFPESVHKARLRAAAKVAAAEGSGIAHAPLPPKQLSLAKRLFGPLAVFAPSKTLASASGRPGRDWSLTWLALGLFCVLLSAGIFQIKYLFAEHVYGWNSVEMSYYITYVGGLRALNMLVFMPLILSRLKPKPTSQPGASSTPDAAYTQAVMTFDLRVARVAVFLDILSHTLVLSPLTSSPFTFCAFTGLSSIAAVLVPTVQSIALSLFNRNPRNVETGVGALFGAISAIQAIGQMILGPLLFGVVYSGTVATFPKAIFAVASGLVCVGFASLLLIRTGPPSSGNAAAKKKGKGKARVVERERGRSRVVKRVGDRHIAEALAQSESVMGTSGSVGGSSSA